MAEAELLEERLTEAGLPADAVVLSPPPTPDAAPPPEGPWVIVPWGEQYVVGGVARGKLRTYETLWSLDDAVRLAVQLAGTPAESRAPGEPDDLRERGERTAAAIRDRTLARDGRPGPAELAGGDLLDALEPETAHHLYALGTPFPQRSEPPTHIGNPYVRYEVLRALVLAEEGVAAPWFEQPGGGSLVVLQRPIRWYVDQGFLVVLADADRP